MMEQKPTRFKKSCSFNGCKNNNTTGVHMHRFPQHKTRCDLWVKAAQNEKLKGLSASKLHNCNVLCSDHFQDWCFMNASSKLRLVHNAIPCSPKPAPPLKVFLDPTSDASTSAEGKRYLEVLVTTPLPSQTLPLKAAKKSQQKMKEELVDNGEEEPFPPETPAVSPVVVNTTTISKDPVVSSPEANLTQSRPMKKPKVTFYPIISKVVPQSNESQVEDDEELELYMKLLTRKLKNYKGMERRQIMHEIDGVFLRKPSAPPTTTSRTQFLMASFEHSASSSLSDVN